MCIRDRQINTTWDQTSKEAIWAQPELLSIIQTQKENGLFDQISAEMERKKLLGEIPANTPFLQAYKIAGDALVASNSLILPEDAPAPKADPANLTKAAQPTVDPKAERVLGTRTAAPKSDASTNDKAKAAASPQSVSYTHLDVYKRQEDNWSIHCSAQTDPASGRMAIIGPYRAFPWL